MNCYELLQEVKNIKNFKSDNELAEFLGVKRQSINGIKKGGGFSNDIAIKVAEITKRSLSEILIIREIQGEQNEKIRKAWENISKLSGIAASVAMACILSSSDVEAAGFSSVSTLSCYTLYEVF
ncbi:MAG TPA: helix-turn-helix domain-containing protein [Methylobacter sp.]|jgi:predicted transcriptional regulator